MKKLFRSLAFCLCVSFSASIFAVAGWGGTSTGLISSSIINAFDVAMFSAGPHLNKPTCSTQGDDWSFNISTNSGKAMLSMLLSAQAQSKQVFVTGLGDCSAWGDRETVRNIRVAW